MKKFFFLLLAVVLTTSCGTYRRVSKDTASTWVGHTTTQIMQALGGPDQIDSDGDGGSILRYEAKPNYEDPDYDILDPSPAPVTEGHAYFYMNQEGICYRVDSNRALPAPPDKPRSVMGVSLLVDLFVFLPFLIFILI